MTVSGSVSVNVADHSGVLMFLWNTSSSVVPCIPPSFKFVSALVEREFVEPTNPPSINIISPMPHIGRSCTRVNIAGETLPAFERSVFNVQPSEFDASSEPMPSWWHWAYHTRDLPKKRSVFKSHKSHTSTTTNAFIKYLLEVYSC